jgi:D-alanine-D-alanine ligase
LKDKIKIGVFFGGRSREREVSFAGGRTVYDNLDKSIFEPVPIFVDSFGQFIILDWQYIYKGTIRDFYPPTPFLEGFSNDYQVYAESLELSFNDKKKLANSVGNIIYPHEFSTLFDFAFLALHGSYGEDGFIQGLLEWYDIPYSGSGLLGSSIGINKKIQMLALFFIREAKMKLMHTLI